MRKKKLEELEQYDYVDDEFIGEARPDYMKAIGLFVLEFSALEHSINLQVADQINNGAHFPGYYVIELLSSRDKIDLLYRMVLGYFEKNSKERIKFLKLVNRLRDLNTFRNKIVHANWMSVKKDGTVRTRIIVNEEEGDVQFERTKITPKLIHEKCIECSKTRDELEKLDEFLQDAFNS